MNKILITIWDQIWDQVRRQPAAYTVTGLGALGAVLIAFLHLDGAEAAYLSGGLTALGTIVTACLARPVNFTVLAGAAVTLLQSLVLFNVHLSSGEIAALVTALNFALGIIGIPTVAQSKAVTAENRAAEAARLDVLASRIAARLSTPEKM